MRRPCLVCANVCAMVGIGMWLGNCGWAVNVLVNAGFEEGDFDGTVPPGWTAGVARNPGPTHREFETRGDLPRVGQKSAGHLNLRGNPDEAILYQQAAVQPGGQYTASVLRRLFRDSSTQPQSHTFGLAVDPAGGVDYYAAGVVRLEQQAAGDSDVTMHLPPVTAAGPLMTFFLYSKNVEQARSHWGHWFDAAVLDGPAGPTATPTATPTPTGPDADGDGLLDSIESVNLPLAAGKSNFLLPDTDSDGRRDGEEDANRNGGLDAGETSTRHADSDGDRYEDGFEALILGSNPLSNASPGTPFVDADGDHLPAPHDPNDGDKDSDDDRYDDMIEAAFFGALPPVSNPAQKPPLGDVNGDGFVANLDALVVQSLFLGNVAYNSSVFDRGPLHIDGYRYGDVGRDGSMSNVDALLIHSFFLGNLPTLPMRM